MNMGAIISNLARAIYAIISREVRNFRENYNVVIPSPVGSDQVNSHNNEAHSLNIERWAEIRVSYHVDETEFLVYFSVFNDRQLQIMTGVVHLDPSVDPDVQIVVRFINPISGESHGMSFSYPIDIQMLRNFFF